MKLRTITDKADWEGTTVLVRSSLNIPLKEGKPRNFFRIERALPTLRYLHEQGAKVIVLAHIGREPDETLEPVYEALTKYLPVQWGGRIDGDEFQTRKGMMQNGDILIAENMRQHDGEKANDAAFVAELATLGEVYVNDAFAAAHREHASTYGVAQALPAYAGLTMQEEVTALSAALDPEKPGLFLLGGAKFDTKMPLIEKFLELYDQVFVGGALANDVFKARGLEVGASMVSDVSLADAPILRNPKLLVPVDVVVDGPDGKQVKEVDAVATEERILDAGPATVELLKTKIGEAATVLWNGPFGAYEMGFVESTEATAKLLAEADAKTIIGGGDTVAAIEELELNDEYDFVSIGGGSTLAFLEEGTTSVIELLRAD